MAKNVFLEKFFHFFEKNWFTKVLLKDILIIAKLNKVLNKVCRYNSLNKKPKTND